MYSVHLFGQPCSPWCWWCAAKGSACKLWFCITYIWSVCCCLCAHNCCSANCTIKVLLAGDVCHVHHLSTLIFAKWHNLMAVPLDLGEWPKLWLILRGHCCIKHYIDPSNRWTSSKSTWGKIRGSKETLEFMHYFLLQSIQQLWRYYSLWWFEPYCHSQSCSTCLFVKLKEKSDLQDGMEMYTQQI